MKEVDVSKLSDGSRKPGIRWTKKQSESVFENVDLFPKSAKKLKVTIRLIQSLKSLYGALTAMHHLPII